METSDAWFRTLLEPWAQATWETDAQGVVLEASPSWCAYTGQTAEQQQGEGWVQAVHPDERASVLTMWRASVRKAVPLDLELRIDHGGEWRWSHVRAVPVLDAEGRVERWRGLHVDITRRKQIEQDERLVSERNAFLVKLSDTLRSVDEPLAVQASAVRLLAEQLGASRVLTATVLDDEETLEVHADHNLPGLPSVVGCHRLAVFGPDRVATLRAGRTLIVDGEDRLSGQQSGAPAPPGVNVHAYVGVPLLRDGRLIGLLTAHQTEPPEWTAASVRLIEEAAGRIWSAVDLARQKQSLRRSHDDLERRVAERTAELSRINARLAHLQEEERRRIARDLHDQSGQMIAGLLLTLRGAMDEVRTQPERALEHLAEVQRATRLLGKQVHDLAVRLRPAALDDLGLQAALRELTSEWASRTGVPVDLQALGIEQERLPVEVETTLYRMVQEALTNIAKHADAHQVSVTVNHLDGHATAVVEDDGRGFDPASTSGRLGLMGMRERVTLAGGELDIESRPGAGTVLIVRLPVADAAAAPAAP